MSRSRSLPTVLQTLDNRFLAISNWSTFYSEVKFQNSEHVCHLPLVSVSSVDVCLRDVAIIFMSNTDELAVLLLYRSVSDEALRSERALGVRLC